MLRVVEKLAREIDELRTPQNELLQSGALKMSHEALEAKIDEYVRRHREVRHDPGRVKSGPEGGWR